jgi:hypothetical protein
MDTKGNGRLINYSAQEIIKKMDKEIISLYKPRFRILKKILCFINIHQVVDIGWNQIINGKLKHIKQCINCTKYFYRRGNKI